MSDQAGGGEGGRRGGLFHFPPFPEGELGGNGAVKEQDKSCVSETSSQGFLPIVSFAEKVKVIFFLLHSRRKGIFFFLHWRKSESGARVLTI